MKIILLRYAIHGGFYLHYQSLTEFTGLIKKN